MNKLDKLSKIFWDNMLTEFPNNTLFQDLNEQSRDILRKSVDLVLKESKEIDEQELMEEWERNTHDKKLWGVGNDW